MEERISLDSLSNRNVIVVKETVATDGYVLRTHRVGYDNSMQGRQQVENEVAEPYKSVIFMMWGDIPTVTENNDI